MDFISPVIDIVSRLLDPITQRIRYAVKLRVNIDSVKNAMNELMRVRDEVKTKVDIAERQLLVGKSRVKRWLESVEAIEREVNGMEEAYQQMRRCLGNCRPNCWSGYKLSKRAAEKLTDVTELKIIGDSFDVVAEKPPPDVVEEQPSTSALGMDLMLEKVRGCLMEDSVGVVGIYGMGGVGKTTLLRKINDETTHGFNVVIWVVVSKEVNVAKIKNEIGKRLGLIRQENDEIPAADIHKALSKMKFMLLLDDIWQRLDLELVRIPRPSNESKVVFTTRFENVCYEMKAEKKVKVECLGWKEAWDLFRENVGEEALNSCGDIPGRAEPIAKECGGLPLMLITIGRAMASKKTPEEWKHAITAPRSSPSDISGTETEVFFRLKFSYDSLRDDIIKSCFLYCSLFPEDFDISKEDLIDYWIGEGFLDVWDDDLDSARNKGHDLIGTLKSACLLESSYNEKTEVKMHDVIRDLALWISSGCGEKKNNFLEAPTIERRTEANRISLMENKIIEITETPKCPDLLTLMLQNNSQRCMLDPIARRIRYVVNLRENVNSLKEAMNELKCISNDVKTRVDVAERKLLKIKDEVQYWLERVGATERGVNEIEDSFQQMTRCFGNCRPNCWSGYKLGKRVAKKLTDVADLKTKGKDASFNVVAKMQPSMLEKVRGFLREDSVGVVGIYGMGGVGKTTLLRKINNETTHGFNLVIWVVVSKEVNVAKIKNEIGKRLGLIRQENDEIPAADIHKALSKMKFMLLLDDIWQRLDLETVGIPLRSGQSKVVFTTRFENVCYEMKAEKKVKVECLGWKEAWDLFRENVGEEALNSCGDIPGRAEPIAKECGGLPLMLITIGRAMASKKTPEEWKHAITALRSSPSDISGTETEVLFRLKFSYDSLRDGIIKSCFLYCSLFPEDYDISKERLIDNWIREGFLDECDDDLDSAHKKGHDLIGTLKSACLLESGFNEKTEVKMHDVIRDLALWISKKKKKFLVKAGVGLREAPAIERWTEASRISLMKNQIKEITETPNCPDLLTLMLQRNWSLEKITNDFLKFMPHLRVLDLSFSFIKEIPAGIGNLVELRYLNLSYTRIKNLPEEIGCLTKLKHLDLNGCYRFDGIPREAIWRLSRLKVLKLLKDEFSYSEATEESGWFYLREMEGLKWLSHLEITIETVDDLKSYLDSHKLPKLTRDLSIGFCKGMTTSTLLSSSFRAMSSIRHLNILNCKEMEEMMIGWDVEKEDDHSVSSLESLTFWGLNNLNIIRVGGCIQNLCHINIAFCSKMKSVTWILQLQNLEEMWIQHCKGVEEVIDTSDVRIPVREACLRRLKFLHLRQLPKLTSICNHEYLAFPSLKMLEVYKCPKLKKLPIGLQSANNPLKEINGEKEWWDGLEWEEDVIKSNLLPLFQERIR